MALQAHETNRAHAAMSEFGASPEQAASFVGGLSAAGFDLTTIFKIIDLVRTNWSWVKDDWDKFQKLIQDLIAIFKTQSPAPPGPVNM